MRNYLFLNNFLYDWINVRREKKTILSYLHTRKMTNQEAENCRGISLLNACYMHYIVEF
jgi:hypothetical protein